MTMDYEIAKKLKEAKFPFKWEEVWEDVAETVKGFYQYPTLRELIDGCGDSFGSLHKHAFGWLAAGINKVSATSSIDVNEGGATPEAAVANLFIKINQK